MTATRFLYRWETHAVDERDRHDHARRILPKSDDKTIERSQRERYVAQRTLVDDRNVYRTRRMRAERYGARSTARNPSNARSYNVDAKSHRHLHHRTRVRAT